MVKAKFHYAIQLASWSQTWFPTCRRQVRAIWTCRDSSNLVADGFSAGRRPARKTACEPDHELDSVMEFGLYWTTCGYAYSPTTQLADWTDCGLVTGSIVRIARCRYLSYSEADFEVFCPTRATCCTDGGEIWHGPLLRAIFHPRRCNDKGTGPPKVKFLLRFDQNVEYKRPAGAYPLRDFHKN